MRHPATDVAIWGARDEVLSYSAVPTHAGSNTHEVARTFNVGCLFYERFVNVFTLLSALPRGRGTHGATLG